MKNATTNTIRKTYDMTAIMRRAWDIRKTAAAEMGCWVSEVVFSLCLKQAWAEAEGVNAEANAAAVAAEWAGLAPEKRVEWLQRCVVRASRDVIGYSTEDHYHQYYERSAWSLHGHDFDEYVNQAYIALAKALEHLPVTNKRRAEKGLRPRSVKSLVYNAAKAAVMKIWNDDKKHRRAVQDPQVVNDNGEIESYIETRISAGGSVNTETSAIIWADLERFSAGRDEIYRKIIELVKENYTERKISAALDSKISNVAVHKRIVKMRAALQAAGIA